MIHIQRFHETFHRFVFSSRYQVASAARHPTGIKPEHHSYEECAGEPHGDQDSGGNA